VRIRISERAKDAFAWLAAAAIIVAGIIFVVVST
jgi:hypothetical protein